MYSDEEIKREVSNIIDSGYYINGPHAKGFEDEFSTYIGTRHGISTSSGTTALFTVFMHLNLQLGDEIIVPSHTFIASITPAIILGAKPVFVDIDPETYVMNAEEVRQKITEKTRAIVCVHIYGHPVDLGPIMEIAEEKGIKLIEDCAQAHGSKYKGKKVGNFGDFACFSFFPSKIMTVGGDGGMILTNDDAAGEELEMLKNHGRKEKYTHEILGTNFRLSEIQAAIGRHQLKHLPEFIEKRNNAVELYNEQLSKIKPIMTPHVAAWADPAYYVYTIQTGNRDELRRFLKKHSIATGIYYPIPVHKQPIIAKKFGETSLPITERTCSRILSLPLYPDLRGKDIHYIVDKIEKFYRKRSY